MVNNVYAQIGLVMLIGLAAKNAILIVEFARLEYEKGKSLMDAALTGARIRLRPILMTSYAFILGCVPFGPRPDRARYRAGFSARWLSAAWLAATGIAIFLIPVTFYLIEKLPPEKERGSRSPHSFCAGAAPLRSPNQE